MVVPLFAAAAATIGRIAASVAKTVGQALAQGGKATAQGATQAAGTAGQTLAQGGKATAQGATQAAGTAGQTLAQGGKATAQGATQAAGTAGQALPQPSNKFEWARNFDRELGKIDKRNLNLPKIPPQIPAQKNAPKGGSSDPRGRPPNKPASPIKASPTPSQSLQRNKMMESIMDTRRQNDPGSIKAAKNFLKKRIPAGKTRKKMGIGIALLLLLVATSYDTLDIIITLLGIYFGIDDYGILDILYFPTTVGFWLYFRIKKISKRGLFLLGYLIEYFPFLDVLNLQTVYALIIIWTNMTKTGENFAKAIPTPPKVNPLPKAA